MNKDVRDLAEEIKLSKQDGKSGNKLGKDRNAPWRTSSAIKRMSATWPELWKLIRSAQDKALIFAAAGRDIRDSDDEDEVEEPIPGPPEILPRASPRSTAAPKRKRDVIQTLDEGSPSTKKTKK